MEFKIGYLLVGVAFISSVGYLYKSFYKNNDD